jgi:hypothetical protein
VIRSSLVRIAAVAVAIVALSACRVDSTISLKVNPNGSGSVTVVVTADKEIVAKTESLESDLRTSDLTAAGWKVGTLRTTTTGGRSLTLVHSFRTPAEATRILSTINNSRGPLKNVVLARSGKETKSTFTVNGKLEVNGGLAAFADDAAIKLLGDSPYAGELNASGLDLGKAVGITFTVELPGKLNSTTGVQQTNTVKWQVPMDGSSTDIATSSTNVAIGSSVARVGRVVILALLALWIAATLILLLLVMGSRNRRHR